MKHIPLTSRKKQELTLVSNHFIDQYMPKANGEYVKLYLTLLCALQNDRDISLSLLAEQLDFTEKDVVRALNYWQKQGVLFLTTNASQEITSICLADLDSSEDPELMHSLPETVREPKEKKEPESLANTQKKSFTPEQLTALKSQEDVQMLFAVAEPYIGRSLSPNETTLFLHIYEELDFNFELFEYLLEYCAERNKKSVRYMEKVAMDWHENQIKTVEEARNHSGKYQTEYYQVLKAFGISNRAPAPAEIEAMSHWIHDLKLSMDLILEACRRTILKTSSASFPYAGSILEDWAKNNVRNMTDLVALDQRYAKKQAEKAAERSAPKTQKSAPRTQFHNFTQRDYDFNELEKQLLGIPLQKRDPS